MLRLADEIVIAVALQVVGIIADGFIHQELLRHLPWLVVPMLAECA